MSEMLGLYGGAVAVAAASALIPVINAELFLAGLVLVVGGEPTRAVILGLLVALGQMLGKSVVYGAMRTTSHLGRQAKAGKLARVHALLARWKDRPQLLMLLSATVSVPPYLLVAALAGRMRIRFRTFFAVGLLGRSLRFVTIALVAALV